MKLFLSIIATSLSIATAPLASTFGPLVEANDLAQALETEQPVLLDIRNKGYEDSMLMVHFGLHTSYFVERKKIRVLYSILTC